METLFNYFVKHQESTEDFHTLILTMYETVEGNKANLIDKNLTSDELSKIWACCNDLRLIFENAQLFPNYKSFTKRINAKLFSECSIDDCLKAFRKLSKLYLGIPTKNEFSRELMLELERIIKESVED